MKSELFSKLGVGTVQFGLDYGISNKEGITLPDEAKNILDFAKENGIKYIDTAAGYGTSESVIGKCIGKSHGFNIVTKTVRFSNGEVTPDDIKLLENTLHSSLKKMGQESVYGLMFHNADDVLKASGQRLVDAMTKFKETGLVKKIGVSVYSSEQIENLLERYNLDMIQVPISVLDQRLLQKGIIKSMKERSIEVHARSIFMQGLLLMDPDTLHPYFDKARDHLKKYRNAIKEMNLNPLKAALGFVLGLSDVDVLICGVNNRAQLSQICSEASIVDTEAFREFALFYEDILNPSLWKVT